MTSGDRYDYLTSLEGATHSLFGGDPEEIVLRAARVGEGARTLRDLAGEARREAERYTRLHADGWRLVGAFTGGEARCRKHSPDEDQDKEQDEEVAPPAGKPGLPPARVQDVVDGASSLREAAARLRLAADGWEGAHADGRRLAEPVADGHVRLQ